MSEAKGERKIDRPLFMQPWPGYWRTREKLKRSKRFQDLLRHRERWGSDIDLAQPIEKLIPGVEKNAAFMRIDPEIEKLQQLVYWDLNLLAGVNTGVLWKDPYDVGDEQKERRYDLILDYFRLPRRAGMEHHAFESVMRALNNGIGVFEAREKKAFWEMFNPLIWLAHLIRMPITVMERAGFGAHEKTQQLLIGSYAKFMKIAMGVILIFIGLKLGVDVPWKDLLNGLIAWFLKL